MALFRRKPADDRARLVISGHRSEWLVGTENYRQVYARARAEQPVLVELVPEVGNPHDPNAIAGHVDGQVAGYLKAEFAAKYRAPLVEASELGFRLFVKTEYRPRAGGDMGMGWLDIPSPEALKTWLSMPEGERARGFDLPAGKSPSTPRAVGRPL